MIKLVKPDASYSVRPRKPITDLNLTRQEYDPNAQTFRPSFRLIIFFDRGRIAIDDKVSKAISIILSTVSKTAAVQRSDGERKAKADKSTAGDYVFGLKAQGVITGNRC